MNKGFVSSRGHGPAIVLVHAFPFNSEMWKHQVESLAGTMYVITYDLPGFGNNSARPVFTDMEQCADQLIGILDEEQISSCILAGCSMGGYIAMAVLRKFPERLRGLILANTRAGADSEEARQNRLRQSHEVRGNGMNPLIEEMLPKLISENSRTPKAGLEQEVRSMMESSSPEGTIGMLNAMSSRVDSSDTLSSARIPACVIVGQNDVLTPPQEARILSDLLPDSELHIVSGSGHLTNMENPEVFNSIVANFCTRIL